MEYTKDELLEIGRRVYEGEFTIRTAAAEFDISVERARYYMRRYRDINHLGPKNGNSEVTYRVGNTGSPRSISIESMKTMTREELVSALMDRDIALARLKRNYEVLSDGTVIVYDSKITKR